MSLAVFVLLSTAGFLAGYALVRGILHIWNAPRDVSRLREERRRDAARSALTESIMLLAEGNFAESEKRALTDIAGAESPLAHYLIAARAAAGRNDSRACDDYLAHARRIAGDRALAVGMAQAQLQFEAREYDRALAALTGARTLRPRDPQVANLLARVYERLGDWDGLVRLVHELRRRRILPAARLDELEITARRELLRLKLPASATDVLRRAWAELPPVFRQRPDFVAIHADHLIQHGQMDEAAVLLRHAIDHDWDENLVRLYGMAQTPDAGAQLSVAEDWARQHRDSPALLLALGRIAGRIPDPVRAGNYLARARKAGAADAAQELARVLAESGERDRALDVLLPATTPRHAPA
jgi:HemY protein